MTDQAPKRKRGGQPGNHNRLKHGRYMAKENLRVFPSTSSDQLSTLDHLIVAIKKTIDHTYAVGLTSTDNSEINKTLRSLSLAAYGLCRLLYLRDRLTSVPYFLRHAGKEEILQTLSKLNRL
mgnify:CR=1 FL=1